MLYHVLRNDECELSTHIEIDGAIWYVILPCSQWTEKFKL